mgnify:CR=1 FL=1
MIYAVERGNPKGRKPIEWKLITTLPVRSRAEAIEKIEKALPTAFDIKFAFNKWTLGEGFCREVLKLDPAAMDAPDFDMLKTLGFSKGEIEAANLYVCGAMTLEGAPFLKGEHYPVFDCANPCGRTGKRYLDLMAMLKLNVFHWHLVDDGGWRLEIPAGPAGR